jgi:AmmeMemoRadiSam system protein A
MPAADRQGEILLRLARAAIARRFGLMLECSDNETFLHEPGASFVTLKYEGRLRGCIGSLQAHRPLREDITHNAQAAAFRDPRFSPLSAAEYNQIALEVSLLSPLTPMRVEDEADALDQLRPGVDGVVLQHGSKRGTFLPQVWDSLPDPGQFLTELKRKAGLAAHFWSADVQLFRYGVYKWTED